jgi:hypothetical protein
LPRAVQKQRNELFAKKVLVENPLPKKYGGNFLKTKTPIFFGQFSPNFLGRGEFKNTKTNIGQEIAILRQKRPTYLHWFSFLFVLGAP